MSSVNFSVVVPVYQGARWIANAVDSVLAQTLPPAEIIVCDDGSTDDLHEELDKYRGRLTVLRQENRGRAAALNTCCRKATGDFVVCLDADDTWLPQRLERMGELLAEVPDIDIVTTDALVEIGQQSLRFYSDCVPPFPSDLEDQRCEILGRNFIFSGAALRRSRWEEIGGFDEGLRYVEDYDCWIRMILSGSTARLVADPLVVYRLHDANVSRNKREMLETEIRVLRKAGHRVDLSENERSILDEHLAHELANLAIVESRLAVDCGARDARSRSWSVVRNRHCSSRQRLRAGAAVISPRLVREVDARRRRG